MTAAKPKEGVVKAYTTKRQSPEDQWDADRIKQVKGTPQQPNPNKQGIGIPIQIGFDPTPSTEPERSCDAKKETVPRRMMITKDMLDEYGYTEGCDACHKKRAGITHRTQHTEECRHGLRERMSTTDSGKKRLAETGERINRRMEEQIVRSEGDKRKQENDDDQDKRGKKEEQTQKTEDSKMDQRPKEEEEEEVNRDQTMTETPFNIPSTKRNQRNEEEPQEGEPKDKIPKQSPNEAEQNHDGDLLMALMRVSNKIEQELIEMHSPPRVTKQAQEWGMKAGAAMDLTTGWDFRKQKDRDKAWKYIEEHKPGVVIGSQLQNLTNWNDTKQHKWCEAVKHIQFMIKVYQYQID